MSHAIRALVFALSLVALDAAAITAQQRDTTAQLSSEPERIAASVLLSSLGSAGGLYLGAIAAYGQSSHSGAYITLTLSTTMGAALGASGVSDGWKGPLVGSVVGMVVGFGVAKAAAGGLDTGGTFFTYSLTHGLVTTLIARGWSR